MLTKFVLYTKEQEYELGENDLRNWDEIQCSYKRDGFGGIIRSFSSQFIFVNGAKEVVQSLYLSEGFESSAEISIQTLDNNWRYNECFRCPLDFSTISWDADSVSINCIDNSLEALVKANKGTKYEFEVGSDIISDKTLKYDRISLIENLTYEFTQGEAVNDTAELIVTFKKDENPYIGNVSKEILVNGLVRWNDDQTNDPDSFILRVVKDVVLTLDYDVKWRRDVGYGGVSIGIVVKRNGTIVTDAVTDSSGVASDHLFLMDSPALTNIGNFSSSEELIASCPNPTTSAPWGTVNGIVWSVRMIGNNYVWVESGKTVEEYFTIREYGIRTISLLRGDVVTITATLNEDSGTQAVRRIVSSKFIFNWNVRDKSIDIPVISPERAASALLQRICRDNFNIWVSVSNFDSRIKNTYLAAAESVRGIENARFYSSFTEFCDWMSAVFGYVYYLGKRKPSRFVNQKVCGEYESSPWAYLDAEYNGPVDSNKIIYISGHGCFMYNPNGSTLYARWPGWEEYNDSATGHPRTDTLFIIRELSEDNYYYFQDYDGTDLLPILFDNAGLEAQGEYTVYFVHRSELFHSSEDKRRIESVKEFQYSVNASMIYSEVTVGYEKKDYDKVNGRDEFNFTNTYITGCALGDNTLSLISKYRADSYGIEFAALKRNEKTTDSGSDNDVFFILCKDVNGNLIPDRDCVIENVISDTMFNGAFSPMACIRANADYIAAQQAGLVLHFTSSTGFSDVSIDGEKLSADITLTDSCLSCGTISFKSDDIEDNVDINKSIEIEIDGKSYIGFLSEVDVHFSKSESSNYKLIVKEIKT